MPSKVEELRQDLVSGFGQAPPCMARPTYLTVVTNMVIKTVDSLISAAHAEGVAEGAEAERKYLHDAAIAYMQPDGMSDPTCGGMYPSYTVAREAMSHVPASVLAGK